MDKLKKIVSVLLTLPMIISLMVGVISSESNVAFAYSDLTENKNEFSFDDNIMLSIFWPPTEKYITDEQYKLIAEAGINWVMGSGEETLCTPENQAKMLKLCAKYGIGMTVSDGSFGDTLLNKTEKEIADAVAKYENVPSADGFYIRDEPRNPNIYIDAYVALKKAAPDKYMHLNFYPNTVHAIPEMYKAQMNDWCRLAANAGYPLDYLMFDRYPFPLKDGEMDRENFFSNVRFCYEAGLENNVKTGLYIQTVCQEELFRKPTDSEIRYEMYSSLAFGFKQLSFFTWFTPVNRSEPFRDGIISSDGKPNAHYETIKNINKEVLTLGSTLVKCDALEVYFNGRDTYGQPSVPEDFFVKADENDSVILSFMRHKETGRNYLMVVNNDFSASQEIELTFDDKINQLYQVSRTDGSLEEMSLENQKLKIELSAGDGAFIALPEDFDHFKNDSVQPETKTNLALNSMITAPESLGTNGWYISCLQDGKRSSETDRNGWKAADTDSTYLNVDLRKTLKFNRIDIYPAGSVYERGSTLPSEISISVSKDGKNFNEIKTIKDTKLDSFKGIQIDLPETEAQYIRFDMKGSNGGSYIALNEIEIYNDDGSVPDIIQEPEPEKIVTYTKDSNIALKKTVFCSSTTPDEYKVWNWHPTFVNDGKADTGWSSNVGLNETADSTEYIAIDFGDVFAVEKVVLTAHGFFPEDYFVELSEDGINWTKIKEVKGAPARKSGKELNIKVDSPINARFVKVTGTKLRSGGVDGFLLQFGEIEAYGKPVCDKTELQNAIDTYLSKGGKNDKEYQNALAGIENELLTQTQANSLTFALSALNDSLKDQSEVSSDSQEASLESETTSEESSSADNDSSGSNLIWIIVCVGLCLSVCGIFGLNKKAKKTE